MIEKWHIGNFQAIYDTEFILSPLTVFCGNNSVVNTFFESFSMMTKFSKVKYEVDDFFYKEPGTHKHASCETNVNFSLKTGKDINVHVDLGLTLGTKNNLYVLSSHLKREINEREYLFVKYYARARFEYFKPGKTFYKNKIDASHNFSSMPLKDNFLLDAYSADSTRKKHYSKEGVGKYSFTFPYVEVKEFLPEAIIYPDIESVYSYNTKKNICESFYKLICGIPVDPIKTEEEAENYTNKNLYTHCIDKETADYLLDLLVTPQEDFYPNALSYIFNMDHYFSDYKCRDDDYSPYCIRLSDWYKTLSNIDIKEKELIIKKIQDDLDGICDNIGQCLLKYTNSFNIKEAARFKLPYHLKEAREHVRRFFNTGAKSAYPCIRYIKRLPNNIKDDLYIEKIKEICLCTKPFSTIVITEPEAKLQQDKFKLELAEFIMAVTQNDRQVILKTNCDTIINCFRNKTDDQIKIYS